MKNLFKRIAKSSKIVYSIYFYMCSFILNIIRVFISMDKHLILFVVYGGQRYDDSPRFVYEYMKEHEKYKKFKFMWAFIDPSSVPEVPDTEKIKIDTWSYYKAALQAKYWITNSSVSRGLHFKKKETINIMFQHGMAGIKKIGNDLDSTNKSFKNGYDEKFDLIMIEGKKEEEILKKAWNISGDELRQTGLPRNDELVHKSPDEILALKKKLNIPTDKKVILYAPTFREYSKDSKLATFLKPPFDFDLWNQELGKEYVLLLTAHYEVAKLMEVPEQHPFVRNAFKYPHINDLMLVSDLLISDYSSIIWDYSILGKPILSYAYDYSQYKKTRGVYEGYENIFFHGIMKTEEEVIRYLKSMDYSLECKYTKEKIREEYIAEYGSSTDKCVKMIFGN